MPRFMLAGVSFRPIEAKAALNEMQIGTALDLVRDPLNDFDENAVQVHHKGMFLGFVPRNLTFALAKQMDNGQEFNAYFLKRVGKQYEIEYDERRTDNDHVQSA